MSAGKLKRKPTPGCVKCPKYRPTTRYIVKVESDQTVTVLAVCKRHDKRKGK